MSEQQVFIVTYYLECGDLGSFSSTHVCLIDGNKVSIKKSTAHTLAGDINVTGLLSRSAIDDIEDLAIDQRARVENVLSQLEQFGGAS